MAEQTKEEVLDELFDQVVKVLKSELQKEEVHPGHVANALRLLKDNKVERIPVPGSGLPDIAASLPFPKMKHG